MTGINNITQHKPNEKQNIVNKLHQLWNTQKEKKSI